MELEVINRPELQRTSQDVQMDVGAATAPWRAVGDLGRAIQGTAPVFAQIAEKRQNLKDSAQISRARNHMRELDAQIQRQIAEAPPEEWENIAASAWEGAMEDLKGYGVGASGEANQQIGLEIETMWGKSTSAVKTQRTVRDIEDDNAAIEAEARELAKNGDRDGAIAVLATGNWTKKQLNDRAEAILDAGAYDEQLRFLDGFQTVEEHEEYLKMLDEKEDGKFTQFTNLSKPARDRLHSITRSRVKNMKRDQTKTYREVVEDVGIGKKNAAEARDELEMVGVPEEQIQKIETIASALEVAEENNAQVQYIEDSLHQNWFEQRFNGNRNEEEFLEILGSISDVKASKATKVRLTKKWLDAWSSDISDSKLELVGQGKLTLDKEEVEFHQNLFNEYKKALDIVKLPESVVGGMITNQIRDFTDWYRSLPEKPSQEALGVKFNIYLRELYGTSSATSQASSFGDW